MGVSLAHDTACGVLFTLHALGNHHIQQPSRPKTTASPNPQVQLTMGLSTYSW